MLGIIGGSGFNQLASLDVSHREVVRTPYGEPSGPVTLGRIAGRQVAFIARHGHGHTIPPHRVNYRANIFALHSLGAKEVVSVASVGGIRADMAPGVLVAPDQIIDYTSGREMTFHDGGNGVVLHVDFTEPYDPGLRARLLATARRIDEAVIDGAVYATTQGPRLESAAEVNRLQRDGADIVGMTGMPEASLAREMQLPYAAICVVANWAAGRADSAHGISFDHIEEILQQTMGRVRGLIEAFCAE
ncbi:MAG TPA: S-methyl-5'-thioinosine phosphorylase [Rhodocyclaceae bacterium]|nr:S-methyl-5'-thioinosine phosphorylase [Rhodocyclaceae bacterium]